MSFAVVVQNVEVSWVQEIAVFRITKIHNPTFFRLPISVKDENALITEGLLHSTDSIEGDETIRERLCLLVPFLASIDIIREVCGEPIGELWRGFRVAGNALVSNVGARRIQVGLYLEGTDGNQQCCDNKHRPH